MRNLIILIIQLLQHLFPRKIQPRPALAKDLRATLNHFLNWLVWVLGLESLLQVAPRIRIQPIQTKPLVVDFIHEFWQLLISEIVLLIDHLVFVEELGGVSVEAADVLLLLGFASSFGGALA